jgi:hypothetical protein
VPDSEHRPPKFAGESMTATILRFSALSVSSNHPDPTTVRRHYDRLNSIAIASFWLHPFRYDQGQYLEACLALKVRVVLLPSNWSGQAGTTCYPLMQSIRIIDRLISIEIA